MLYEIHNTTGDMSFMHFYDVVCNFRRRVRKRRLIVIPFSLRASAVYRPVKKWVRAVIFVSSVKWGSSSASSPVGWSRLFVYLWTVVCRMPPSWALVDPLFCLRGEFIVRVGEDVHAITSSIVGGQAHDAQVTHDIIPSSWTGSATVNITF